VYGPWDVPSCARLRRATWRSVRNVRRPHARPEKSGLRKSAEQLQNGGQLQNDVLSPSAGQVPNAIRLRSGDRPPSVQKPLNADRPGNLTRRAPQWRKRKQRRKRRRADCHQRKIRSQLTRLSSADRFARLTENCNVHAKSCLDGHADYAGHREFFDLDSLERRSFGMAAHHRLSCQRSRPHSDLVLARDSAADPTAAVNDKTILASPPSPPRRRNTVLIKLNLCSERANHR
jgi:hypothetical protein